MNNTSFQGIEVISSNKTLITSKDKNLLNQHCVLISSCNCLIKFKDT